MAGSNLRNVLLRLSMDLAQRCLAVVFAPGPVWRVILHEETRPSPWMPSHPKLAQYSQKQLGETEIWFSVQIGRGQVSGEQVGIGGCGDHGGVVGGKGAAGEKYIDAL